MNASNAHVYPHIRLFEAYESASYIYKSYIYDKYEFHLVHIGCQSYKERWKIEKKSLNGLLYLVHMGDFYNHFSIIFFLICGLFFAFT
jgi:hypothetical protein